MSKPGPILDFFFEAGDFALFASAETPFRVRILGETNLNGDKYYIVAGPELLMKQEDLSGNSFLAYSEDSVPTDWIVDILEPDDLDTCAKNAHLRVIGV